MVKFKITKAGSRNSSYAHSFKQVYDIVERLTGDEMLAIETSSWAELACVGEEYETDQILIEVVEE